MSDAKSHVLKNLRVSRWGSRFCREFLPKPLITQNRGWGGGYTAIGDEFREREFAKRRNRLAYVHPNSRVNPN